MPTPVLSFTNVSIGEPGAPDVQVERFRAEVELAPLLKGEVRIIQMSVERPRFRVDLADLSGTATPGAPRGWRIDAQRVSLARLEILDGEAAVRDSRAGREWTLEGIDAVVEAGSLHGPAKISGNLQLDGTPLTLRAGIGRYDASAVPVNMTLGSPLYPLDLSVDGSLQLNAGAPPSYTGSATLAGIPPRSDDAAPSPWSEFRATGEFALSPSELVVEKGQVSYGAMERPLVLQASGRLDFAGEPHFNLDVDARQIDVDKALGGVQGPAAAADGLTALIAMLPAVPRPPIPGELHVDAQGVVVGGSIIQAVGIDLATTPQGWRVDTLAAMLPGETRIDLTGALTTVGDLAFRGHARVDAARPAAFAAWWRGQTGSASSLSSFTLEADVDIRPEAQHLTDLQIAVGEGTATGTIDIRRFQQSEQLFVNVDLRSDTFDLDQGRALTELLAGNAVGAGRIDQMTVALRAGTLTSHGLDARWVVLDGTLAGDTIDLGQLSIADLAGAAIVARGRITDPWGTPSGRLDASVKAQDLSSTAKFFADLFPDSRVLRHLTGVSPSLSPVDAEIVAEAGEDGALSMDFNGSFAGTHMNLAASGTGPLRRPLELNGTASLHLDNPDTAKALTQLGLQPLPVAAGPLRLDVKFDGGAADGTLALEGTVAGADVRYTAASTLVDGAVHLDGDATLDAADVDPLMLLAGFAVPGLGEGHPAKAAARLGLTAAQVQASLTSASFDGEPVTGSLELRLGDTVSVGGALDLQAASLPALASLATGAVPGIEAGSWADTAFSRAMPPDLDVDLEIGAARLDIGLPQTVADARLHLVLEGDALNIDLTQGGFAGGQLKGALAGTLRDGEADMTLRGTVEAGQLQALAWERSGLPVASGSVDLSFDLGARGRSMAGLVSTLAGTGSFVVNDTRLNTLNPQALLAVMEGANGKKPPDEEAARETFAIGFGSGAVTLGRASGSFAVEGGVLKVPVVSVEAPDATILAEATIDLNTLTLTSEWTVRAGEADATAGARPQVRLLFSGPLSRPERQVDVAPLLEALRSRYLQRQLDELEKLEAARREAEARRQRFEAEQAAQPPPSTGSVSPTPDTPPAVAPDDAPAGAFGAPSLLEPFDSAEPESSPGAR